jgi:hypothetical protein
VKTGFARKSTPVPEGPAADEITVLIFIFQRFKRRPPNRPPVMIHHIF